MKEYYNRIYYIIIYQIFIFMKYTRWGVVHLRKLFPKLYREYSKSNSYFFRKKLFDKIIKNFYIIYNKKIGTIKQIWNKYNESHNVLLIKIYI